MMTSKRMNLILLMIVFMGMEAKAAQQCYKCSGLNADDETMFFMIFVSAIEHHLPKPLEDQCIKDPSTLVTCNSYCVDLVATVNLENIGAMDFGTSYDDYALDEIHWIGNTRVAIRGCLDDMVDDIEKLKDYSEMLAIGKEDACIKGQFNISGINADADICFCQTDGCNKKQPKRTVIAGDLPEPINTTNYTASCPALQQIYTSIEPDVCIEECKSDAECSAKKQICCNVGGCDYLCSSPVQHKPFLGSSCSQMSFTEETLRNTMNNFTTDDNYWNGMLPEIYPYVPPSSMQCFNQTAKTMKHCQTLAYAFGLQADFTNFEEQSAEKIELLKKLLEDVSSLSMDVLDIDQRGKMSAVMRGCVEETYPSVFSSGFPKIGPISGTLQMNKTIMGANVEFQLYICNTDECNLLSVAPKLMSDEQLMAANVTYFSQELNEQRDNGCERRNVVQSTVILLLPLLIASLLRY